MIPERNCWLINVITISSCKEQKQTKKGVLARMGSRKVSLRQTLSQCTFVRVAFYEGTTSGRNKISFFLFFWRTSCQRQDWLTILSLAFLIRYDGWEHAKKSSNNSRRPCQRRRYPILSLTSQEYLDGSVHIEYRMYFEKPSRDTSAPPPIRMFCTGAPNRPISSIFLSLSHSSLSFFF